MPTNMPLGTLEDLRDKEEQRRRNDDDDDDDDRRRWEEEDDLRRDNLRKMAEDDDDDYCDYGEPTIINNTYDGEVVTRYTRLYEPRDIARVEKVRVYELAKDCNLAPKDLVAKIRELGIDVANHMSNISLADAARVRLVCGIRT